MIREDMIVHLLSVRRLLKCKNQRPCSMFQSRMMQSQLRTTLRGQSDEMSTKDLCKKPYSLVVNS